jgi:alkylation response protein AidB-like acyl-CoA dehydrogenase
LLISGDDGLSAIEDATDFAITGQCAEAVGGMDKVIKTTAEYLKTRRAYGTTLNKFQALQHRMADMFIELELSRSMLYCIFAAFSEPSQRKRSALVSSAKALIGNSARFVASNGVQLHGAQGMADDCVIGQHFKQLAVLQGLFGSPDFHWEQCAAYLKEELIQSIDAQSPKETEEPAPAPQRQVSRTAEPAAVTVSG